MSKKGGTQTTTTSPDAFTDAARRDVWQRAVGAASAPYQAYTGQMVAGVNPMTMRGLNGAFDAITQFQNYQPGSFATGDIGAYTNPHEQAVIQGMQGDFDRARAQSLMSVDDVATRAGAFGGSRHGVMAGTALGDIARAEGNAIAGVRQQGFNDAAARMEADQNRDFMYQQQRLGTAGQLANLGLSGGGYLRNAEQDALTAQYGQFLEGRGWNQQQAGLLGQMLAGLPSGSTSTTQMPGSGLGGFLGGALSLGSMFLPGGGLAGIFGGGGQPAFSPVPVQTTMQPSVPIPDIMRPTLSRVG